MIEQAKTEKRNSDSPDMAADPSAQMIRFGNRAPFQTVLETVLFFNADIRFRDIVQQHGCR